MVDTETSPWPEIDTSANQILSFFGRKGSGKSVAARSFYRHWPDVDKLCIDVNGDAEPGEDAQRITGDPPKKMPARGDDNEPLNLHYVADPASPTYREDLDRALGMSIFPRDRRTLTWVDEVGEVIPVGKTGPNARVALMQGRHFGASMLACGPRPMNIDPLVIAQSDRVLMFDVPNEDDRDRIRSIIGWPRKSFEEAYLEVRRLNSVQPFHFLQYVAGEHQLYICPPLPDEWRA